MRTTRRAGARLLLRLGPLLLVLGAVTAEAQPEATPSTSPGSATVLEPDASPPATDQAPLALSLEEAVARGLRENVAVLLAATGIEAASGARKEVLARLFPQLRGSVSESRVKINLAAYGFPTPPGESAVIGPFPLFDARLSLEQSLFDAAALARAAAARHRLEAKRLDARAIQQQVAGAVANLYLATLASDAAIEAARAVVDTAQATATTTEDLHDAGNAAGIDVVRANLTLNRQRQRLIAAQNLYAKDVVALERAIGLPLGRPLELVDQVPFESVDLDDLGAALLEARERRPDLASARAQLAAGDAALAAAKRQRVPSIAAHGDYGPIGSTPADARSTFALSAAVHVPLFEGRRIAGEVRRSRAQRDAAQIRLQDLDQQVEVDMRNAYLDFESASKQVEVARDALDLADLQLTQTRDLFAAGIGDSLEVSVAQEAVATANAQYVASLYAYGRAKVALALAIGTADTALVHFLLGSTQ